MGGPLKCISSPPVSVADLEVAGVGYADDVAREGFVHYVFSFVP